jgi:phosphoenolpyruvate carboxykinase (ATP)
MDTTKAAIIRAELAKTGLRWANCISWNDSAETLECLALDRGEVSQTAAGALVAQTGQHTGRSPRDKFIVRDEETESRIWWDNNASLTRQQFDLLRADMMQHARLKSLFVQDLIAGADPTYAVATRVVTELAWHALFIRHLLRVPAAEADFSARLTIVNLPSFKADPERHGTRSDTVIAIDLTHKLVLIGGTQYAGEIKKAVFTVLNDVLPDQGVLPMHCSANIGKTGDTAIFFGLSGTGKTTLSTDPQRVLIGDDEHGWSREGVFNFEGGCYAKVINLSRENEPEIFQAAETKGTILENVVLSTETGRVDFADASMTENTRAAYPLDAIVNASAIGRGGVPKAIFMLTADAFGILPPVALLTANEAMYHFLSGYTAKVAGTERGVKEPQATFSACFGAPFLPRSPQVYDEMLRDLITKHHVPCYLVNTGWTGGEYGTGKRISIAASRAILAAALSGELDQCKTRRDEHFGFRVPLTVTGVADKLMTPRQCWSDSTSYDIAAARLVRLFADNFRAYSDAVNETIRDAGPALRVAAE